MSARYDKVLEKILRGTSDGNIVFSELCDLLVFLGFSERMQESRHIFAKQGVQEILNLQPQTNNKVKVYQVKQVRQIILRYKLGGKSGEV